MICKNCNKEFFTKNAKRVRCDNCVATTYQQKIQRRINQFRSFDINNLTINELIEMDKKYESIVNSAIYHSSKHNIPISEYGI